MILSQHGKQLNIWPLGFWSSNQYLFIRRQEKAKWLRRGITHNEVGEFAEDTTFQMTGGLKSRRGTPGEPIKLGHWETC